MVEDEFHSSKIINFYTLHSQAFFLKCVDVNYVTDTPVIFQIGCYFDKAIWS